MGGYGNVHRVDLSLRIELDAVASQAATASSPKLEHQNENTAGYDSPGYRSSPRQGRTIEIAGTGIAGTR
eukprot:5551816-Pyramimonas_sp.AAC.1